MKSKFLAVCLLGVISIVACDEVGNPGTSDGTGVQADGGSHDSSIGPSADADAGAGSDTGVGTDADTAAEVDSTTADLTAPLVCPKPGQKPEQTVKMAMTNYTGNGEPFLEDDCAWPELHSIWSKIAALGDKAVFAYVEGSEFGFCSDEPGAVPCNLLPSLAPSTWKYKGPSWDVSPQIAAEYSNSPRIRFKYLNTQDKQLHGYVYAAITDCTDNGCEGREPNTEFWCMANLAISGEDIILKMKCEDDNGGKKNLGTWKLDKLP